MSLTDIMSGAGLSGYAEVGLVISFAIFIGVVIWALRRPREEMEARARTVLDPDNAEPPPGTASEQRRITGR